MISQDAQVIFRRAGVDDLPGLARIHQLSFKDAMPHLPELHTVEEYLTFYTHTVFPGSTLWVAVMAGTLAGFISFRSGWVDHLYIHPAHQGTGIGTQLLELAKSSHRSLRLWTFQRNARARNFYEKHGFRSVQETDGTGNEERQPDVCYSWTSEEA